MSKEKRTRVSVITEDNHYSFADIAMLARKYHQGKFYKLLIMVMINNVGYVF